MFQFVFDRFEDDRKLPKKYWPNAGEFGDYEVESDHTTTALTSKNGKSGFVLVGIPNPCPDSIGKMMEMKEDYIRRGIRASPEVVDFVDKVAGFAWSKPRSKK